MNKLSVFNSNELEGSSMNKLSVFNSNEFGNVRVLKINNEPWFVGKDICIVFGDTNYRRSLSKIDDDEKGVSQIDTPGGKQNMIVINESGLYSLLFTMEPRKANMDIDLVEERVKKLKRFKRWVTGEVLPAIRKHGVYATEAMLADPDTLIAALMELKAEREKRKQLTATINVQNQQIAEMQPKVSYYDVVLNCKDLVAISTISKDYGWSARKMNRYLHEKGIQFKQGDIWLLYQKHAKQGYTSTKVHPYNGKDGTVHTRPHTYWTQKGRLFIYSVLKADGIIPLIEQGV